MTIGDIARKANVSSATVSRVINNSGYVGSETRALVEQELLRSGYRHRLNSARGRKKVLVTCGDVASAVYTAYLRPLLSILESNGMFVFVAYSSYDADLEESYLDFAFSQNFSGIVMLSAIGTPRLVELVRGAPCPVVFVNRYLREIDTDIVATDSYRGGYIATKYLIDAGHRRIVHLGGPKNSTTCHDRLRGFLDCMSDNGLPVSDSDVVYGDLQPDSGTALAKMFLSGSIGATAIFSANDVMARAFADELTANGVGIPKKVSVICADNTSATVSPGVRLTSVGFDDRLIGEAAAALLIERMENPDGRKKKVVYCPSIFERDSVSSPE